MSQQYQPKLTPGNLKKMLELQAKETAREQALGVAVNIVTSAVHGLNILDPDKVVAAVFALADRFAPKFEADKVAARIAEMQASTEEVPETNVAA